MSQEVYRYNFAEHVDLQEVQATLVLSILAVESLHGQTQTRLDASHYIDEVGRACVIDGGTQVGKDLNRLFAGYLMREFGDDAFAVQRLATNSASKEAPAGITAP